MVDVYAPNGGRVTYVHVTPEKARQIVAQHIVNGKAVVEWALAR
jgi:NADP-reducing hydrogenase subunit HndB